MLESTNNSEQFHDYTIAIAGDASGPHGQIEKSFSAKGAKTALIPSIDATLSDYLTKTPCDVLILITKPKDIKHIKVIVQDISESGHRPAIMWTISDKFIPLTDGFTPYESKSEELTKLIYHGLLINKDLLQHG